MPWKNGESVACRPERLREIIRQALQAIDLWSPEAEELLLGTAAKESHLGRWCRQLGGGPALGPFQIEPFTERDTWENFLEYRPQLRAMVTAATGLTGPDPARLTEDPFYGAIIARLKYRRAPGPLPPAHDVQAQADYWKAHYNTEGGKGRPEEYVETYYKLVLQA